MRNRIAQIPKGNGKMRRLGIPTIKDREIQGALKLILEPVFEADFQSGSYGYRPKRRAGQAISQVAKGIVEEKTRDIDLDQKAYFNTIRHDIQLSKVAKRIEDDKVVHLLKINDEIQWKTWSPARFCDFTVTKQYLPNRFR